MIGNVQITAADLALECGGRLDHIGESDTADRVTVLVTARGRRAAKQWTIGPDGAPLLEGYDAGHLYRTESHRVASLADLAALLERLSERPRSLVIRGEPLPGTLDTIGARRHHDHPDRGAGRYEDVPRRWVAHDLDKIPLGRGYDLRDPSQAREAVERLRAMLSAEWRRAACYAQLTASAGQGEPSHVSARLWYYLDRPASRAALEAWAVATRAPVDLSIYRCVQPHYTARPIFAPPLADPIAERGFLLGGDPVAWLADYPPPRPARPEREPYVPRPRDDAHDTHGRRYARATLEALARELAGAGEGERHRTLIAAAFRAGGLVPGQWLTPEEIHDELGAAALAAGLTGARETEVHRTINDGIDSGARGAPWDPPQPRGHA